MKWRRLSMADENGQIPVDGVMRAKAHADAMRAAQASAARTDVEPAAAGISSGSWTWLGPGNIGGRVRAIAVHPTSTSTIFVGSVGGGIWKTTNGGASWNYVNDFIANLAVSSIIFRPGAPATMYAGTGEGFYNADGIQGAGIFKSTDSGVTWTQLPATANSNFFFINHMAMSSDGATLLAATRSGLWRSTDQGVTFTKVLAPSGSPYRSDITDVHFLTASSTLAVASGFSSDAYYSTNGGVTWTPAAGLTAKNFSHVEMAVTANQPTWVYLSVDNNPQVSGSGQIWKSTDSGVNYTLISTPGHLDAQGWYDNTIWVAPNDANRLVFAGQLMGMSINGGATFTVLSYGAYIHPDHHAVVSDPGYDGVSNKKVYFGNDGGVYKATDVTTAFNSPGGFTALNNNLGVTQFYGIGGNTTSGKIVGGTQDNGTLLYTPAGGAQAWSAEFGGDGGFSAADRTDRNYLYGE